MDRKEEITSWGKIYYYNFNEGRFALYIYNDDENTIYLSNVYVNPNKRKNNIGNTILNFVFKESLTMKCKEIWLKCINSSWVHNWYQRKGFKDICVDTDNSSYIWMKKELENM